MKYRKNTTTKNYRDQGLIVAKPKKTLWQKIISLFKKGYNK